MHFLSSGIKSVVQFAVYSRLHFKDLQAHPACGNGNDGLRRSLQATLDRIAMQ